VRILNKAHKIEIILMKAELRTEKGIRCSETTILGNFYIVNTKLNFESQFRFSFPYDTLNRIEKERVGDMKFNLAISAQAAIYEEIIFTNKQSKIFVAEIDKGHGYVDFQIPQSMWVKSILSQTGHKSFRLVELPLRSSIIPEEYSTSLKELDEAERFFLIGEFDQAVAHCRSALDPFKPKKEEIRKYVKSKHEFVWYNKMLEFSDEWLVKVVRATASFTSKPHHPPSMNNFGRGNAEIIMMITTSIIA
jgi:hypothetical protein